MSRDQLEREVALIRSEGGHCSICDCPVYVGTELVHVQGKRHRSTVLAGAQALLAARQCRLCGINVANFGVALQHFTSARHLKHKQPAQKAAASAPVARQPPVSASAPPPPAPRSQPPQPRHAQESDDDLDDDAEYSEEALDIYDTGICTICNVKVVRDIQIAIQHVEGAKHQLRVTLANSNWPGRMNELQQDQGGLSLRLTANGRAVPAGQPISVEVGQPIEVTLALTNDSKRRVFIKTVLGIPTLKLQQLGLSFALRDRLALPPRHTTGGLFKRVLNGTQALLGTHPCIVAFQTNKVLLVRAFEVRIVASGTLGEIEKMTAAAIAQPFHAQRRVKGEALRPSDFVVLSGEAPVAIASAKGFYVNLLGYFDLPKLHMMKARVDALTKLALNNYSEHFRTLLFLEEQQMWVDIGAYDRQASMDRTSGSLLRLKVEGLAENRPSVQKGDEILACSVPFTGAARRGTQGGNNVYAGIVHRIDQEHVFLSFHRDFMSSFISGRSYHLRFTFNRIPLRRQHQAATDFHQAQAVARLMPSLTSAEIAAAAAVAKAAVQSSGGSVLLTVTADAGECDEWVDKHVLVKGVKAVGLDTESAIILYAPNELALIQIATANAVLLFRAYRVPHLPARLQHLLESAAITKYSFGTERDLAALCPIRNNVDVQHKYYAERGINMAGVEEVATYYVPGHGFTKDKPMQTSNWTADPLSQRQREYAARDAMVALAIGKEITRRAELKAAGQPVSGAPANSLFSSLVNFVFGGASAADGSSSSPAVSSPTPSSSSLPKLTFTSRIDFNDLQQTAIVNIVHGTHHPKAPYVLFGPPGTGKTTVLVEAIEQLLKLKNPSCATISSVAGSQAAVRILAVAPSNSAADLFVERLAHLGRDQIFRLNAISRSVDGTPVIIREHSNVIEAGAATSFGLLKREQLLKYRVIVTTAVSGSCLSGVGLMPGDISHIFIDESGHATEPEALATIGGLVDAKTTRIILGGDPQQLGPIIRSSEAIKHGLGISLLERLIKEADTNSNSPYFRPGGPIGPYPPRYMVKLLNNYRSHPEILTVPNGLYYGGELLACAEKITRQSLCAWPGWSNKNTAFPLLMHHIEGKEMREGTSPSWFNPDEAAVVMDYVAQLLAWKPGGLALKDIGIITPYNRQVQKLRAMAEKREWNKTENKTELKIGSVEEFQGQERRVIIVSTVRSQLVSLTSFDVKFNLGFVNQPKRLNVTLTRAKQGLIIVGNANVLQTDPNWQRLLLHCFDNKGVAGGFVPKGRDNSSGSSDSLDGDLGSVMRLLQETDERAKRADQEAADREEEKQMDGMDVANPDTPWSGDR